MPRAEHDADRALNPAHHVTEAQGVVNPTQSGAQNLTSRSQLFRPAARRRARAQCSLSPRRHHQRKWPPSVRDPRLVHGCRAPSAVRLPGPRLAFYEETLRARGARAVATDRVGCGPLSVGP